MFCVKSIYLEGVDVMLLLDAEGRNRQLVSLFLRGEEPGVGGIEYVFSVHVPVCFPVT